MDYHGDIPRQWSPLIGQYQFISLEYQLITHPTRITPSTVTQIGNIYTHVLNENISSGLVVTDISDHLPNFQITNNLLVNNENEKSYISYILYSSLVLPYLLYCIPLLRNTYKSRLSKIYYKINLSE